MPPRLPTQNKPKMMDEIVEPAGSPRPRRQNALVKTLGDDPIVSLPVLVS